MILILGKLILLISWASARQLWISVLMFTCVGYIDWTNVLTPRLLGSAWLTVCRKWWLWGNSSIPLGLFRCWLRNRRPAAHQLCAFVHLPCFPYWYSPAEDTKDVSRFCWASGNPGKALCLHGLFLPPRQNRHLHGKKRRFIELGLHNMKLNYKMWISMFSWMLRLALLILVT